MPGMPLDMRNLMAEKYRQSGLTAQAQANQANANAALQRQQAGVIKPLAESQMGLEKTQAGLNTANTEYRNKETSRYDEMADADIFNKNAQAKNYIADARLNTVRADELPRMNDSIIGMQSAQTDDYRSTTQWRGPLSESTIASQRAQIGLAGAQGRNLDADTEQRNMLVPFGMPRLKRGLTRVPGKGDGDKVPAMLEPDEAVLNKDAAGMLGREKIAKLNAKGNQKRDQRDAAFLDRLIKAMTSGMV